MSGKRRRQTAKEKVRLANGILIIGEVQSMHSGVVFLWCSCCKVQWLSCMQSSAYYATKLFSISSLLAQKYDALNDINISKIPKL